MTDAGPSKRYCLVVWTVALLLPALLLATIAVPWFGQVQRLDAEIAAADDQLQRLRRLIATLPGLRAELEQVRSNREFKAFYFDAPTPALAGAELQRQVQDIVTAAKGRLISTQLLPEERSEQPPRVRLRTQIQGSTETLLDILYQIEQARPFLFVEQLSVRSSARPDQPEQQIRGRAARRPPANEAGELTVRLDIFGFALGGRT
jgi:general secretion pathway protein M